ncbi:MAG: hypothetical protein HC882_09495 [Acidobacteria bacterium]|nr:hypothetical protein [Acidobacteriota bacterium]
MNDAVEIISLGGCGGFGMNATLFVAGDEGILVDFGTGFPARPSRRSDPPRPRCKSCRHRASLAAS